jgi:hypothetical protein
VLAVVEVEHLTTPMAVVELSILEVVEVVEVVLLELLLAATAALAL